MTDTSPPELPQKKIYEKPLLKTSKGSIENGVVSPASEKSRFRDIIEMKVDNGELDIKARKNVSDWLKTQSDRKNYRMMEKMMRIDPLTKLDTRKAMFGRDNGKVDDDCEMSRLFLNANRSNNPLSVIMMDADHFKSVNEINGHPAGDEVLRNLAKIVKNSIRKSDIAARYGGEEIMVVLENTALEDAALLAEKIRKEIVKAKISNPTDEVQTMSLGVVCYEKTNNMIKNYNDLVLAADEALKKAKETGKNRTVKKNEKGEFEQIKTTSINATPLNSQPTVTTE